MVSSTESMAFTTSSKLTQSIHLPVGQDGEGEYSAATKGCFDVIDTATPLVLTEIAQQSERDSGASAYHIADYGTADGGTSLGLLSKMVNAVRERGSKDKEVVLHYEDQATNEWQSVFNHVLGTRNVVDAYGKIIETPYKLGGVFTEACGVGFHSQCYPSNSIDFGVSFTAMHWLSSCTEPSLKSRSEMHAARCSVAPKYEKDLAMKDWISILQARSNELVKGGKFVCVNFCVSKDNYFLGATDRGANMWDSFQTAWDQLKEQGLIDEEERLGVSFPSYYRTMDEFLEGIEKVPELKVISAQEKIVRCPYRELYLSEKSDSMSGREYAEWFVPTTRTWSNSIFRGALGDGRTDKDEVMNQFWENYMNLVKEDPGSHGMDYVHAYLVLEKV